jgi:hypothetical protein
MNDLRFTIYDLQFAIDLTRKGSVLSDGNSSVLLCVAPYLKFSPCNKYRVAIQINE